jgi:hypothetical protein
MRLFFAQSSLRRCSALTTASGPPAALVIHDQRLPPGFSMRLMDSCAVGIDLGPASLSIRNAW